MNVSHVQYCMSDIYVTGSSLMMMFLWKFGNVWGKFLRLRKHPSLALSCWDSLHLK